MAFIIPLLWILFYIVCIAGVFLATLWVLRYIGLPIPPQVDKFGLLPHCLARVDLAGYSRRWLRGFPNAKGS